VIGESMEDIPMNPECAKCPLSGKNNPCTRIFQRWNWTHDVRRPEFVALIFDMVSNHPEAECIKLNLDMCEIENRRDKGIRIKPVKKM